MKEDNMHALLLATLVGIRNRAEHKYFDPITMQMTLQRICEDADQAIETFRKSRK